MRLCAVNGDWLWAPTATLLARRGVGLGREVKKESEERVLVIVSGFIHDVGGFLDEHPGGRALLLGRQGKDATAAFCGGVYEHGNAAYNVRLAHPPWCAGLPTHRLRLSAAAFHDACWRAAWRGRARESDYPW